MGRYNNSCTTTVYNASGKNITSEYWIIKGYGEIEILPATLKLTAASHSITFDPDNMVKIELPELHSVSGLIAGHSVALGEGAIHPAYDLFLPGEVENVIDASLVSVKSGDVDVTRNYKIEVVSGILKIEQSQT